MYKSTKYATAVGFMMAAIICGLVSTFYWVWPDTNTKYNESELTLEQKEELKANATELLSNQFTAYLEGVPTPTGTLSSYMQDIKESAVPTKTEVSYERNWNIIYGWGGVGLFCFLFSATFYVSASRFYEGIISILNARAKRISKDNDMDKEMFRRFKDTMQIMEDNANR